VGCCRELDPAECKSFSILFLKLMWQKDLWNSSNLSKVSKRWSTEDLPIYPTVPTLPRIDSPSGILTARPKSDILIWPGRKKETKQHKADTVRWPKLVQNHNCCHCYQYSYNLLFRHFKKKVFWIAELQSFHW